MVRIREIELRDFKNTHNGKIQIYDLEGGGSVLGLYGQNGSGKTSVIEAIDCFKRLAVGGCLDNGAADYIAADAQSFSVMLAIDLGPDAFVNKDDGSVSLIGPAGDFLKEGCRAYYEFEVGRLSDDSAVTLLSESLAVSTASYSKRTLVKYSASRKNQDAEEGKDVIEFPFVFANHDAMTSNQPTFLLSPAGKWKPVQAFCIEAAQQIAAGESISFKKGQSFIFSEYFVNALSLAFSEYARGEKKIPATVHNAMVDVVIPLIGLCMALMSFALYYLHVSCTDRNGMISLGHLTIDEIDGQVEGAVSAPRFMVLPLFEPADIAVGDLESLESTVRSINRPLSAIVPGLNIVVRRMGLANDEEGNEVMRIELMSDRRGTQVPFRAESEGIQKLASVLGMLVMAYNNECACVVIDELDSGVFEFLLGELLEAMAVGGKGQLIFTAHNLRALETLPTKAVLFTTVNPDSRYLRFRRKKPSHNLRNQYLRAINLGGQKEIVYDPTDIVDIRAALYDAGHPELSGFDFDALLDSMERKDG